MIDSVDFCSFLAAKGTGQGFLRFDMPGARNIKMFLLHFLQTSDLTELSYDLYRRSLTPGAYSLNKQLSNRAPL